jgi:hypothetical protein
MKFSYPGANPKKMGYNASAVRIYNTASSLHSAFMADEYFLLGMKNTLAY